MSDHFITVGEGGPLGSGRLFKNPTLRTLDKLIETNTRDSSRAFDQFSSFLKRQDAQQARLQSQRQTFEARELALQKTRDEASFRKEALKDPVTARAMKAFRRASLILGGSRNVPAKTRQTLVSGAPKTKGLPQDLVEAAGGTREEFKAKVKSFLDDGGVLPQKEFTALNNANQSADSARQREEATAQRGEAAEGRTIEAKREDSFAFLEKELGRPLTSAQKVRLSNAATAKDMVLELSQEIEGKEGKQPFAQTPGKSITPEEVAEFLKQAGGDRDKARSLAQKAGKF